VTEEEAFLYVSRKIQEALAEACGMKTKAYSGAIEYGDTVHLVSIPRDYPFKDLAKEHFMKPAVMCQKVMSAPPYCTIWYYLDFGSGIPALPVTRDMIK
jgi:hypothetical protein